jgi:hypothetical protein
MLCVYFDPFPALSAQTAQQFVWRRVITVCFCHLHTAVGQTPPRDGREVAPTDQPIDALCCYCAAGAGSLTGAHLARSRPRRCAGRTAAYANEASESISEIDSFLN